MTTLKQLRKSKTVDIDTALKDEDADVRWSAIEHPNATKEHISTALKDKNKDVRQAAMRHPNSTKEHISTALKDKNADVRDAARNHQPDGKSPNSIDESRGHKIVATKLKTMKLLKMGATRSDNTPQTTMTNKDFRSFSSFLNLKMQIYSHTDQAKKAKKAGDIGGMNYHNNQAQKLHDIMAGAIVKPHPGEEMGVD